jgi:hypothetical protein
MSLKRLLLGLPMLVVVPLMAFGTLLAGLLMIPLLAVMLVAGLLMLIAFGGTAVNLAGFLWCHDPHLLANTARFAALFVAAASVPMFAGGCLSRLVRRRLPPSPPPLRLEVVRHRYR